MNKNVREQIAKMAEEKKKIKNIIGKDSDLTKSDFEKYVKLKYNVKIYNSICELYLEKYHMDISDEIDQYVDDLAMPIVEASHKVFHYKNSKLKNKDKNETIVFFSYKGNDIIDIFIERGGIIEDSGCFFLFRKDGEERSTREIKRWYGMSDKEAIKIVKKLL